MTKVKTAKKSDLELAQEYVSLSFKHNLKSNTLPNSFHSLNLTQTIAAKKDIKNVKSEMNKIFKKLLNRESIENKDDHFYIHSQCLQIIEESASN